MDVLVSIGFWKWVFWFCLDFGNGCFGFDWILEMDVLI